MRQKVNWQTQLKDLNKFHKEIMSQVGEFVPDPALFRLFNDEYKNYLNGEGGFYYRWLALAVKYLQPKRILELGSYTGGSTLCLFQELPPYSELISVDMKLDLRFCPPEILYHQKTRFVFGDDLDISIYGDKLPVDIDFLFIDTDHCYEQASKEWSIYQHLLREEAIVVVDDIYLNDMPKFWEELNLEKLDISEDCHSSGFGFFVFRNKKKPGLAEKQIKAEHASQKALSLR